MKSNFLLYILILLSLCILLVLGFLLPRFFSNTGFIVFIFIGTLWMLIVAGFLGPKKLKTRMREFQIWFRTKAVTFFPVHPYQTVDEALRGGVKEFVPTKQRIKNFLILIVINLIFAILVIGLLIWMF